MSNDNIPTDEFIEKVVKTLYSPTLQSMILIEMIPKIIQTNFQDVVLYLISSSNYCLMDIYLPQFGNKGLTAEEEYKYNLDLRDMEREIDFLWAILLLWGASNAREKINKVKFDEFLKQFHPFSIFEEPLLEEYAKKFDMTRDEFAEKTKDVYELRTILPDYFFDADFDIVRNSNAYKCLIGQLMEKNPYHQFDRQRYLTDFQQIANFNRQKVKNRFDDPLIASVFRTWFSNPKLYLDLLNSFQSYFLKKIPDEKTYIQNGFSGFRYFFGITTHEPIIKIQYSLVKRALTDKYSPEVAKWFLERFIWEKAGEKYKGGNLAEILELLKTTKAKISTYCGCVTMGMIYSSPFLILRAFTVFLHELSRKKSFQVQKGALFETMGLEIAQQAHLDACKIIIKNMNYISQEPFQILQNQIKLFPKEEIMTIEYPFPDEFNSIPFYEFDLVIKYGQTLWILEFKEVTVARIEEVDSFFYLIRSKDQLLRLKKKVGFLRHFCNLSDGPSFLQNISTYVADIVRNEGVFGMDGLLTVQEFISKINLIRTYVDQGKLEELTKTSKFEEGDFFWS